MAQRLANASCANGEAATPLDNFELPFSRQQIGDILGLTIETVSRQLTRLQREGVIELPTRREVKIRNRSALEAMAG